MPPPRSEPTSANDPSDDGDRGEPSPVASETAQIPPSDEFFLDAPRKATETTKLSRRKAADDKASSLGLPPRGASQAQQFANERRRRSTWTLVAILVLSNILIVGGSSAWLYHRVAAGMEQRVAEAVAHTSPRPVALPEVPKAVPVNTDEWKAPVEEVKRQVLAELAAVDSRSKELQTGVSDANTRSAKLLATLEAALKKTKEQAEATEQRLKAAEEQNKVIVARLRDLAVATQGADQPKAVVVPAETVPGGQPLPDSLSPTQSELVLLKERNRITSLADEAIATAARAPYERLWDELQDPRMVNLVHAIRAEILRVQQFYLAGSRLQKYDIPVAELFPQTPTLRDTQLSDDQLISLLSNPKQIWQNRVKAAWLLGQRKSQQGAEALVAAVKDDSNLDVVKEATFSFEQMTGYRATLFEPKKLEAWWKEFNTLPTLKEPARSPKATKASEKPTATGDKPPAADAQPKPPKPAEP